MKQQTADNIDGGRSKRVCSVVRTTITAPLVVDLVEHDFEVPCLREYVQHHLLSCVVVDKEFIRRTRPHQHCHIHPQTLISSTPGSLWRCLGAHKLLLLRMSARKDTSCILGYRLSLPTRIRLMTGHCRDDHLSTTKEKNGANATIVWSGQLPSSSPAPSTRHVIPGQVGHSFRSYGWTSRRERTLYM